jgi:hypothetical protein
MPREKVGALADKRFDLRTTFGSIAEDGLTRNLGRLRANNTRAVTAQPACPDAHAAVLSRQQRLVVTTLRSMSRLVEPQISSAAATRWRRYRLYLATGDESGDAILSPRVVCRCGKS